MEKDMNSKKNLDKLELLWNYSKSLGLEFDPDWCDHEENNTSHVFVVIAERNENSTQTFDRRTMNTMEKQVIIFY
jgi:hypothetical protein|tara:strand:+ start:122 stop:346 length:225 start_codon:yes stop_codon:yes gene_type:complete